MTERGSKRMGDSGGDYDLLCSREEVGELAAKLERRAHHALMAIGALEGIVPGKTDALELSDLLSYAIEALR